MYAKLTNAVELYRGQPIYINPEHVSAVYEVAKTPGGSLVTIIYGGFQGLAWEVEESLAEAVRILNKSSTGPVAPPQRVAPINETVATIDTVQVKEKEVVVPKKAPAAKKKVAKAVDTSAQ